jgi:hypothetical protein
MRLYLYGSLSREYGTAIPILDRESPASNNPELARVVRELRETPLPDGSIRTLRQVSDAVYRLGYRSTNGAPVALAEIQNLLRTRVKSRLSLPMEQPLTIGQILVQLNIPLKLVQLVMVNHRGVSPDHLVFPGDRIAIFPREYPFFSDWSLYRNNYADLH